MHSTCCCRPLAKKTPDALDQSVSKVLPALLAGLAPTTLPLGKGQGSAPSLLGAQA